MRDGKTQFRSRTFKVAPLTKHETESSPRQSMIRLNFERPPERFLRFPHVSVEPQFESQVIVPLGVPQHQFNDSFQSGDGLIGVLFCDQNLAQCGV